MAEKLTKKSFLEQRMTRTEFLKYGAMALVSLFGIKNFLSLLHHPELIKNQAVSVNQDNRQVFGTRKFGA